jgi:hypothetical protein
MRFSDSYKFAIENVAKSGEKPVSKYEMLTGFFYSRLSCSVPRSSFSVFEQIE